MSRAQGDGQAFGRAKERDNDIVNEGWGAVKSHKIGSPENETLYSNNDVNTISLLACIARIRVRTRLILSCRDITAAL